MNFSADGDDYSFLVLDDDVDDVNVEDEDMDKLLDDAFEFLWPNDDDDNDDDQGKDLPPFPAGARSESIEPLSSNAPTSQPSAPIAPTSSSSRPSDVDFYRHDVKTEAGSTFPTLNELSLQDLQTFPTYEERFSNHEACKTLAIARINEQIAHLKSILEASNYGIVPTPPLTSTMTITTQLSLRDINLSVVRGMMNHDGVKAILAKHASDFIMEVKTERQGMYNSCAVSIEELDDDDVQMMADIGAEVNKTKNKNKTKQTKKTRGGHAKSKNKKSIKRFGANGEPVNAKSLRVYTNGTLHIVGCVNTMECVKYAKIMCEILCSLFSRSDISVVDATINMINTNFKVPGYCIKPQDAFRTLHEAASSKSNIKVTYHPKNHAAVQVKFFPSTRGKPATIMLFHTGNILITGFVRWSELKEAYIFITSFLAEHIEDVGVPCS